MIQSAGGVDDDGDIFLLMEKTEYSYIKISEERLIEYEKLGIDVQDLHDKLLKETDDCDLSDVSIKIQIPRSVPDALDGEGPLTWIVAHSTRFKDNLVWFFFVDVKSNN